MSKDVEGYCPMGCGKTLFVAEGGWITCSFIECPNPTAVADILNNPEHEHIVILREDDFTIRHPLRERLGSALEDCGLHWFLTSLAGPPRRTGRYRVYQRPDGSFGTWEGVS